MRKGGDSITLREINCRRKYHQGPGRQLQMHSVFTIIQTKKIKEWSEVILTSKPLTLTQSVHSESKRTWENYSDQDLIENFCNGVFSLQI